MGWSSSVTIGSALASFGSATGMTSCGSRKRRFPKCPIGFEALLLRGSKILLDLDDAWHLRARASPLRHLLADKMQRLSRRADAITVANAALRDWVIQSGVAASKVTLAPTGLDVGHYDPTPEPDGPFTLGWIGGPFTTEYLESIQGPLRRLSAKACACSWWARIARSRGLPASRSSSIRGRKRRRRSSSPNAMWE